MKDRVDKMLVQKGFVKTRSQALQFIQSGVVFDHGILVSKASSLSTGEYLELRVEEQYVGRGAYKLIGAIKSFDFDIAGKIAADVGASTGGFTQVLLKNNVAKVYAIDVGRDQLDSSLKNDSRVIEMSGVNFRDIETLADRIDLLVSDLSFISLKLVLKNMVSVCNDGADLILLVKPQFEAGRELVGKNGLVDVKYHLDILLEIFEACQDLNLGLMKAKPCDIKGKTGNQEYLFWLKLGAPALFKREQIVEMMK